MFTSSRLPSLRAGKIENGVRALVACLHQRSAEALRVHHTPTSFPPIELRHKAIRATGWTERRGVEQIYHVPDRTCNVVIGGTPCVELLVTLARGMLRLSS